MKKITLILVSLAAIQAAYAQKKHKFGIGLDAAGMLNRPTSWKGYRMKHFVYPYPSIHYSYDKKIYGSIMFQAYGNNLSTDVKYDYDQPHFDTLMKLRQISNLDFVVGTDMLSYFNFSNSFLKKSSLIVQAGAKVIFKGSGFFYAQKSDFPDIHYIDMKSDYAFAVKSTVVRFTGHINYGFQLYKGLHANANLNYGYLFERDSPIIWQLGLRYWF